MKVGMLGNAGLVEVLVESLELFPEMQVVLDPVLEATSGRPLLDEAGRELLLSSLLRRVTLLTPNLPELAQLTGRKSIAGMEDEAASAKELLGRGCKAVLVKGGHREGSKAVDYLYDASGKREFTTERIATNNTRGTGCSLASLIAAGLALGYRMPEAIESAKDRLTAALKKQASDCWLGDGPVLL